MKLPPIGRNAYLLLLLAILMSAHLWHLKNKDSLCSEYARAWLEGTTEILPKYVEACQGITNDYNAAIDKYLAVIVSLMTGYSIGKISKNDVS